MRRFAPAELAGIATARVEHEAGALMPEHAHDEASLSLVVAGAFEETLAGRRRHYAPGALVFKPARTPHETRVEGARALTMNLAPSRDVLTRLGLVRPLVVEGGPACAALFGVALALVGGREREAEVLLARALEELARVIVAAAPVEDAAIRALLGEGLRVDECARRLRMHPATLRRRLRREGAAAPRVLRRRAMVARATRLLASSEEPIAEVAFACGFADQAHLTRTLRRELGLTPRSLRELARAFARD